MQLLQQKALGRAGAVSNKSSMAALRPVLKAPASKRALAIRCEAAPAGGAPSTAETVVATARMVGAC